jgi:hypothetical protein
MIRGVQYRDCRRYYIMLPQSRLSSVYKHGPTTCMGCMLYTYLEEEFGRGTNKGSFPRLLVNTIAAIHKAVAFSARQSMMC